MISFEENNANPNDLVKANKEIQLILCKWTTEEPFNEWAHLNDVTCKNL